MSSGSKFAGKSGRTHFIPSQNRGISPLHQTHSIRDRVTVRHGKDTVKSAKAGNASSAVSPKEESYQLFALPNANVQPFAMMIRLTPELLDELKQAEAEANTPKMKFGASGTGHVIQVGQESFKFSSAPEPGHLCDIYEQKSSEDGHYPLVEAGSVWRKLSVQRTLSASEKDRVKQRTAEAEKKHKQRTSILVDPSTQKIIPQAASVEANGRKPYLNFKKEPPPKKPKVSPVVAPKPRPQHTKVPLGNSHVPSPVLSPVMVSPIPSQGPAPLNQVCVMHPAKGYPLASDGTSGPSPFIKEDILKEKVPPMLSAECVRSTKAGTTLNMADLQNFLITLFQDNPKGLTMKMMEKAVMESMQVNPGRKTIDKVLKLIASYQAPGKYLLNPGVEKGQFVDLAPAISGKPLEVFCVGPKEEEHYSASNGEESEMNEFLSIINVHDAASEPTLAEMQGTTGLDASIHPLEPQLPETKNNELPKQSGAIDVKNATNDGTNTSGSSESYSGSDSASESSDSGNGSDSGSASGSGTDSDGSSSSSGTSVDEDVDIMSDDGNEEGKLKVKDGKPSCKDNSMDVEAPKCEENKLSLPLISAEEAPSFQQIALDLKSSNAVHDHLFHEVFGPDEDVDADVSIDDDVSGWPVNQTMPSIGSAEKLHVECQLEEGEEGWKQTEKPRFDCTSMANKVDGILGRKSSLELDGIIDKKSSNDHVESMRQDKQISSVNHKKEENPKFVQKSTGHTRFGSRLVITSKGGEKQLKGVEKHDLKNASNAIRVKSPEYHILKSHEATTALSREGTIPHNDVRGMDLTCERSNFKSSRTGKPLLEPSFRRGEATIGTTPCQSSAGLPTGCEREAHLSSKGFLNLQQTIKQTNEYRNTEIVHQAGLTVEQAERPLKEGDFTRKGKETDSIRWPSKNGSSPSYISKKEEANLVDPGHVLNSGCKSLAHGGSLGPQDLEVGELRESAPSKSQIFHGKKPQAWGEESRMRQGFDVDAQRHSQWEIGSPHNIDQLRGLMKTKPEITKKSLYKSGVRENCKSKQVVDSVTVMGFQRETLSPRTGKRRPEENYTLKPKRPSKMKVEEALIKLPLQSSKQESSREDGCENVRLNNVGVQEHEVGFSSKTASLEDKKGKSPIDELEGAKLNISNRMKISSTPANLKEKYRDTVKADTFQHNSKIQTPQSCEVQGIDFFAPYEKQEPDLRGPIESYEQYKEYVKEFNEKYPIYLKLNKALESDKEEFELLRNQIEELKQKDDKVKLGNIYRTVRQEYIQSHKRFQRMQNTFGLLHKELQVIKLRCKDYAEKVGQG